ncbi:hypothetical protein B0A49_13520, partial [Cryomyces minteri]
DVAPDELMKYYNLIKDGGIRWNSTLAMIHRVLKLRNAIELYFSRWVQPADDTHDLMEDKLSPEHWNDLERFAVLLQPFKDYTTLLEGNAIEGAQGACWEVLCTLDVFYVHLEAASEEVRDEDSYYATGIEMGSDAVYRAAIALHPACKLDYFTGAWHKWPAWIKRAEKDVKSLVQEYEDAVGTISNSDNETLAIPQPVKKANKLHAMFKANAQPPASDRRPNKRQKVATDWEKFTSLAVDDAVDNPLQWWWDHQTVYPVLSKMAFDLFSIPAKIITLDVDVKKAEMTASVAAAEAKANAAAVADIGGWTVLD